MGRLFRLLIMFGPMLFRMYKKFAGGQQQQNTNLPQKQDDYSRQDNSRRMEGTQRKDGKWDFEEGQNPLG